MIATSQLSYGYDGLPPLSFPDIQCDTNEHALILGPSGAGKTTLLHLLGGLLTPTTGAIRIEDVDLHLLRGKARDTFRGKKIGIVFQRPHFIKSISASENILMAQHTAGNKTDLKKVLALMDRLQIAHKADAHTTRMSVGEQQRLAIVRAVINHPAIILADEPSSALDDQNCHAMIQLLLEIAAENQASLLVVTHDQRIRDEIAKKIYLDKTQPSRL